MNTINIRNMTVQQIKDLGLSFYTLACWSDVVRLVTPWSIVNLWANGYGQAWKGELTIDSLGNFVSFS